MQLVKGVYTNEVWGVGVQNLIQFNHALIGKWLWRYVMERDALWRKLVKIKYDSQMVIGAPRR